MILTQELLDACKGEAGTINATQYAILGQGRQETPLHCRRRVVGAEVAAADYADLLAAKYDQKGVSKRRATPEKRPVGRPRIHPKHPPKAVGPRSIARMVVTNATPPPRGVRVEVWCVGSERKVDEHLAYAWLVHDGVEVVKMRWGEVRYDREAVKSSAVVATLAGFAAACEYLRSLCLNYGVIDICTDNESAMNLMCGAWKPAAPHFISLIGSAVTNLTACDAAVVSYHQKTRIQSRPLRDYVEAAHRGEPGERRTDYSLGADLSLRQVTAGDEAAPTLPGGG